MQKWFWKSTNGSNELDWMLLLWACGQGTETVVSLWKRDNSSSTIGEVWKGMTSNDEVLRWHQKAGNKCLPEFLVAMDINQLLADSYRKEFIKW